MMSTVSKVILNNFSLKSEVTYVLKHTDLIPTKFCTRPTAVVQEFALPLQHCIQEFA